MGKTIYDSKDTFGGYFEDFSVGSVYKHWPGKTITESDNHLSKRNFAETEWT